MKKKLNTDNKRPPSGNKDTGECSVDICIVSSFPSSL